MFKVGDKVKYIGKTPRMGIIWGDVFVLEPYDTDDVLGFLDKDGDWRDIEDIGYEFELVTSKETPKKYNDGKPRTDLISGEFILGLGKALQYGADKYDEDKADTPNYLKGDGFLYSDLIGALERHMAKFKSGINIDEESGLEHILQVAVNAMFLYNYRISGKGIDNRVKLTVDE